MAVAPTGAIYKALEFDNVSSRTYGVYITGEAVYNAPARDVEMITIPGRNGTFALDNGRFENIEVTYPAGIFAANEADFAEAISDFRNFLCSRKGYVRLSDEYNPDEYRMAVYKSGLDVDPKLLKAGEFDITFDCKPQRWLTSGETAVTVDSGDTLNNPTLFESSPLLEVGGSGTVEFNGYEIEFEGVPYGEVEICPHTIPASSSANPYTATITLNTSLLNTGDAIYPAVKDCSVNASLRNPSSPFENLGVGTTANVFDASIDWLNSSDKHRIRMRFHPDFSEGFVFGTTGSIVSTAEFNYTTNAQPAFLRTETIQVTFDYDGADTITVTVSRTGTLPSGVVRTSNGMGLPIMYGNSSKPITDPISIDCDLGEAYIVEDGVYISLNSYIDLGSKLPTLGVGANEVTFDNTITELKITPRWWKV